MQSRLLNSALKYFFTVYFYNFVTNILSLSKKQIKIPNDKVKDNLKINWMSLMSFQ